MSRRLSALAFTLSLAGAAFALDGDVTLSLNVVKHKDNRVQLSGITNLPAGTKLMLSVKEQMDNGFMGQSSCVITDVGTFESESLGPKGGLSHGRYVANATMPIPAVQPANVKRIIGDKGEKLTGPLVEKGSFGVTVSQTTAFSIGDNADEAQAARKQEADAATAALKQQACVLLQQLLKFKDEPKFKEYGFGIGGPYNQWLKSVESLRDSTPTGLLNPIPLVVRTAPGDLLMLGMNYMRKGETDITRQRLSELKETIGYDDFLNPKAKSIAKTKTTKSTSESRTWHDSTGKFSVDATLVATTETHVVLRKTDGKTVQIPITKLSASDVAFVNRTNSEPVSEPANVQTQISPAPNQAPAIPADVTYTVIDDTKLPGIKRSVDIRLNKYVSEETLTAIAKAIKASDKRKYDRTFIAYYLPDMQVDAGCWATTHYDPDLKIQILGLSAADAAKLSAKPEAADRDEIGRWLDERPFVGRRIVIFRDNGKLFMELTYTDGSSGTNEIVEGKSPLGRRFSKPGGSTTGDHWVIDSNGDLQLRDSDGLISTSKQLQ